MGEGVGRGVGSQGSAAETPLWRDGGGGGGGTHVYNIGVTRFRARGRWCPRRAAARPLRRCVLVGARRRRKSYATGRLPRRTRRESDARTACPPSSQPQPQPQPSSSCQRRSHHHRPERNTKIARCTYNIVIPCIKCVLYSYSVLRYLARDSNFRFNNIIILYGRDVVHIFSLNNTIVIYNRRWSFLPREHR